MGFDIDNIISKYLRGELSGREEIKLNQWLDKDPSNKELLDLLSKIWETPLGYPDIVHMDDEQQKIWGKLRNENNYSIPSSIKSVSLTKIILKYAAVLIVFLSLGYVFWNTLTHSRKFDKLITLKPKKL